MPKINKLFYEFEKFHSHPLNIMLHLICIPAILYSYLGLFHTFLKFFSLDLKSELIIYTAFITPGLVVFFNCSLLLTLELILISLPLITLFFITIQNYNSLILLFFILIFSLAWIGQLWGHRIENQKPAFTKEFIFLFIGPLWVINQLNKKITQALKKK